MIHFDRGKYSFSGDKIELLSDMATILEYMIDNDIFSVYDVMKIVTLAMQDAGVNVVGRVYSVDDEDDIDEEDFCDGCDDCSNDGEEIHNSKDEVDEIFDFLKKKRK